MCLIVIAWHGHPDYPLVVAANRDEFYARPTASAAKWTDYPHVIAGRDLEAGGTWLGVGNSGRFAAITNVREPSSAPGKFSRGRLTADYLAGHQSPWGYATQINPRDFSGFNLLLADDRELVYLSNRDTGPRRLLPGVYGLSNRLLDTPWPKLVKAKVDFTSALPALPETHALFALLADDEVVPDHALPDTGVSIEWERLLSAIFVRSPNYGTRASTVLWRSSNGEVYFCEKSFGPEGGLLQSSVISTGV